MKHRIGLAFASLLLGAAATMTPGVGATNPATTATPTAVVTDVGLISTAIGAIGTQLAGVSGVNMVAVTPVIADLQTQAGLITGSTMMSAAQPLVAQIATDLQTLIQLLNGTSVPVNIQNDIVAMQVLLPGAQVGVGPTMRIPRENMTAIIARQVLASP